MYTFCVNPIRPAPSCDRNKTEALTVVTFVMEVCVCASACACMCVCVCLCMCVHMCMHVCVCVCVCVHLRKRMCMIFVMNIKSHTPINCKKQKTKKLSFLLFENINNKIRHTYMYTDTCRVKVATFCFLSGVERVSIN